MWITYTRKDILWITFTGISFLCCFREAIGFVSCSPSPCKNGGVCITSPRGDSSCE
ncbi:uncharacterized protein LOC112905430 [Agrilus planipennis]|uniref:Uncharacterized protein LOC112905430 n=1 Tax=Agrilus planipennis TaxID=224129 RepID=A0A7F5RCD7_AGRPL|nr:uncharacterized protein LOC112905430 [Agrilus planipennis]